MTNVIAAARAMNSAARIKRGIGLMLVALIGWALLAAFVAATHDTEFGFSMAATLVTLLGSFAVVGCLLLGLGLLLWGLLRD